MSAAVEAVGAQRSALPAARLDRPEPTKEPFRIVGRDLRVAAFFGFELV